MTYICQSALFIIQRDGAGFSGMVVCPDFKMDGRGQVSGMLLVFLRTPRSFGDWTDAEGRKMNEGG